ncbi:MAG: hypothetical protein ABSB52_13540 [Acidimicrobiales bacterium]|jgi:hypothetical protein
MNEMSSSPGVVLERRPRLGLKVRRIAVGIVRRDASAALWATQPHGQGEEPGRVGSSLKTSSPQSPTQGGATVSPKDYRTPYEKAYHKAYIQYKLDLAVADEAFNKGVAPFRKEYEKANKPILQAFEEAVKPLAAAHDEACKHAKNDYKKAKGKAQHLKGGPKHKSQ